MKYKQVFLIWLLADAFLALGLLCFAFYELFTGGSKNDIEIFFWMLLYGTCISLPSLLVMLLFHFIFTKNAKNSVTYSIPYVALIIAINMLYLLTGQYVFGMTAEFNVFYFATTAAGLLAFYLVDRKIKKAALIIKEEV